MIDVNEIEAEASWLVRNGCENSCTTEAGDVLELITLLRQAEKDAARYRWIKENSQLGVGKFGFDWELHFEGVAPDNHSLIESHIDEAMNGSNN